jgi:hypothetical protein
MAKGDNVIKMITGASSATLATAVTNFNTAMATFVANSAVAYNPTTGYTLVSSGLAVSPDAAVANDLYTGWAIVTYIAGS